MAERSRLKVPGRRSTAKRSITARVRVSVERIIAAYKPERIILFGSFARGGASRDSDIDLLVIKRRPKEHRLVDRIGKVLEIVPFGEPVDPVVLTPNEVAQRLRVGDFFLQELLDSGVVVYEKPA